MKSIIKYITLFSSVIAFILGCLIMTNAIASTVVINYLLVIALGILGISRICVFASAKDRSAWDLVAGILCIVICFLLLQSDALIVGTTMGIIFAIFAFVEGIGNFIVAAEIRQASKKVPIAGLVIVGILEVLLGIALLCMPLFGEILYIYVIGIFLVVAGICGFIKGLLIKTSKK